MKFNFDSFVILKKEKENYFTVPKLFLSTITVEAMMST
jgi:hypothetical protein